MIALCLWWIYFDLADTSVVGRGRLGARLRLRPLPAAWRVSPCSAWARSSRSRSGDPTLGAGARWALGRRVGAFALSLAVIHLGAEWTSLRDRTFLGRIVLAVFAVARRDGGGVPAVTFVLLVARGVLGQLLLEAFTFPAAARRAFGDLRSLPRVPRRKRGGRLSSSSHRRKARSLYGSRTRRR